MIQLVPHLKVLIAYEPVDFRKNAERTFMRSQPPLARLECASGQPGE